ncbi:MAG: AMP-binding protein [Pseudomonadota bacterium]
MTSKIGAFEKGELRPAVRALIVDLLEQDIVDSESLVAQGLDSLHAENLVEALEELGLAAEYEFLIEDATLDSLMEHVETLETGVARVSIEPSELPETVPLTGPQAIWADLEDAGWQDWANISLCLSVPKSLTSAAWLAAILQVLCDQNDALRAILVRPSGGVQQKTLDRFQLPVALRPAPASEREIMRLIEDFEGEVVSPFGPSARALVLAANDDQDRHWLCLTIHHVFADRLSMHSLERQFKTLLSNGRLEMVSQKTDNFASYASAQFRSAQSAETRAHADTLSKRLADATIHVSRPRPVLSPSLELSLGDLPTTGYLQTTEAHALENCAQSLGTTVPLLLHAVFSALAARLTDDQCETAESHPLLCHVVSNRHHNSDFREVVGCFDTSAPVAPPLRDTDTLPDYCAQTRLAFAQSVRAVSNLRRGDWLDGGDRTEKAAALFERIPHINIVRLPANDASEGAALGVEEHPIRRTQRPRWGLLLRATLPAPDRDSRRGGAKDRNGLRLSAFAEDRELAVAAHFCLTQALRRLIGLTPSELESVTVHQLLETVLEAARFAGQQVDRASALVANTPTQAPFIYERLIERQRRWYAHDERLQLKRDADNRFIGSAENPFPFTQLDKLKERAYLEQLGVPLPKLLHVLSKDALQKALPRLAPSLPKSFVIKPVGAGHSFGVTVVRDGLDLTRNGAPFDPARIATELSEMARLGSCDHQGKTFRFNFSAFLIEELVEDACGFGKATDYKIFMLGSELLWIQLHFQQDGHTWVAFLDADFKLLPQPCWDPQTCWRTHRALVCTEQSMVIARQPNCLRDMLEQSKRLATQMGIFVRLDWYADANAGPLMGEITTFPHMLQPRSFYSSFANARVRQLWRGPDGVAQTAAHGDATHARVEEIVAQAGEAPIGVASFLPSGDTDQPWAIGEGISFGELRSFIDRFDLSSFGVAPGARVALVLPNGAEYAATLLATMNRYVAIPLQEDLPTAFLTSRLHELNADAVIVLADTKSADAVQRLANLNVIQLHREERTALPVLPSAQTDPVAKKAPLRRLDDAVLVLQTSGTTGEPKSIVYDLRRLALAGAGIARSLDLRPDDMGLSVLPLHHVGGITCNLIAPLLSGAPTRFLPGFDPRQVFAALAGSDGARWVYLVPSLWQELLRYADEHPELAQDKPWPNLRILRNAGADLPHDRALALSELFGEGVHIVPTYGMTEAMPIAAPPPQYRLERPNTVGPVVGGMEVEIVCATPDGGTKRVPDGHVGEIAVRGPTVIGRYEREGEPDAEPPVQPFAQPSAPQLTERGFLRTGDLGCLASDGSGWLSVKGRVKEAINRGGETLSPLEIEATMRLAPALKDRDLLVFARAHSTLGQDVGLAVAGAADTIDFAELRSWAATRLPKKMVPVTLLTLPDLPRSAAGKILRTQVADTLNAACSPAELSVLEVFDGSSGKPDLVSRRTDLVSTSEAKPDAGAITIDAVVEAIRACLPQSMAIAQDTHLVDAGVNSLAALELAVHLSERFGANIPDWAVSDHPTPRLLTALLQEVSKDVSLDAPFSPQTAPANHASDRPLRILFLHGEAADAELAERSLQSTFWISGLADRVKFVFIDAPHQSPPRPELHKAAVDAGLYSKPDYRSWRSRDARTLDESLEAAAKALRDLGPIDGIAGVCDGALIAALVASKHADLRLFLNIAGGPPSASARPKDWEIKMPSVHLISQQDTLHSVNQLMEVPGRCEEAFVFQHAFGHVIPPFKGALKDKIEAALTLALEHDKRGDVQPPIEAKSAPIAPTGHANEQKRAAVQTVMEQILGRSDFGPTDDFFDLGGNSMSAIQLSLALEERFGSALPRDLFSLEQVSAERLADVVTDQATDLSPVTFVPLNTSKHRPVIYAMPGRWGHFAGYHALGKALEPYSHLRGLRFNTLLSNDPKASITLDEITQSASDAIARDAKHSPIVCMGFSSGGTFAYETARHLKLQGHAVSLVLIDAKPLFEPMYPPAWKQILRQILGRKPIEKPKRGPNMSLVSFKLRETLHTWKPHPVDLETVLFCPEKGLVTPEYRKLWKRALGDHITFENIPGEHLGIRSPEIAEEVAKRLSKRLTLDA